MNAEIETIKKELKEQNLFLHSMLKSIESSHSTGMFTSGSHTSSIRESKCTAPTTSERPDRREHATGLLTGGGREHFDDIKKGKIKKFEFSKRRSA